jgi:hypothetical protein
LDLHSIRWELVNLHAQQILACSVYKPFADLVQSVAEMASSIPSKGWEHVNLSPGAAEYWRANGTWMRAPLGISGQLVGSDAAIHLVEGHTRLGMLRGLVESGILSGSSTHHVWVGEACTRPHEEGPWREVLKRERMPFADWLMDQIGDEGPLGRVAMRLIDLKHASRHRGALGGDDLRAVLECAQKDPVLIGTTGLIRAAYAKWECVMSV